MGCRCNACRIDLEKSPKRRAGIAAPKAVSAQRAESAVGWHVGAHGFGHGPHVIAGRDDGAFAVRAVVG